MARVDHSITGTVDLSISDAPGEEFERRVTTMLARALRSRRVIAVVGSGISRAYGYPSWPEFALKTVRNALTFVRMSRPTSPEVKQLAAYKSQLKETIASSRALLPERALLMLDLCETACEEVGYRHELRTAMANAVRSPTQRKTFAGDGPLALVMQQFNVRRFLTTNYDHEIERQLELILHSRTPSGKTATTHHPVLSVGPMQHSLVVNREGPAELFKLASNVPGYGYGVFHLHGSVEDPDSMVVTERDYQRVYLQGGVSQSAYRDALRLTFSSNPIIFLGLGMNEPDLLRPLREFLAEQHREARERPIFAVLPAGKSAQDDVERQRFLYVRYGVKALIYPSSKDPVALTKAFVEKIKTLADYALEWSANVPRIPPIRVPRFSKLRVRESSRGNYRTDPYAIAHRQVVEEGPLANLADRRAGEVERIQQSLVRHATLLVTGEPGTGKGSIGLRLIDRSPNVAKAYDKRFFSTMHFTNDFLSTIDAASEHFLGDSRRSVDPLQRFDEALKSGNHLLVIGGLDRLLSPSHLRSASQLPSDRDPTDLPLPVGQPITREVEEFLDIVSRDGRSGTRVALTTDTWPENIKCPPVGHVHLRRIARELVTSRFNDRPDIARCVGNLYDSLRGHAYALSIVVAALDATRSDQDRALRWLKRLVARLETTNEPRRPRLTAYLTVRYWTDQIAPPTRNKWDGILQRVCLYTTPISDDTLHVTFDDRNRSNASNGKRKQLHRAIEDLTKANLLLRVFQRDSEALNRYTAHSLVRAYVVEQLGSPPDAVPEAQRLELTGFTSETAESFPGTVEAHRLATESLDQLLVAADQEFASNAKYTPRATDLARAAFALIRARWTATNVCRHAHFPPETVHGLAITHYDGYKRRLVKVLNALRQIDAIAGEGLANVRPTVHESGVLYADELTWLYNELGLASYCQGELGDATAFFQMARATSEVTEGGRGGQRWCEIQASQALVEIERGRLGRARAQLEQVVQIETQRPKGRKHAGRLSSDKTSTNADPPLDGTPSTSDDFIARARGHLGIVYHLLGEYSAAGQQYSLAIRTLGAVGNQRGLSTVYRSRADLRRRQQNVDGAIRDIQSSMAAAESGQYPDLLHHARIADANLAISQGGFTQSGPVTSSSPLDLIIPATEFAVRMGIPGLAAAAHRARGYLALEQGDSELAARMALLCLWLALSCGMELRVSAALVLLGRVASVRGERRAALELLTSALSFARHQRYQPQVEEAERELLAIGATWA